MQISRIIKILITVFVIFFIHTNLKAEVIKFSSCKYTKDSLSKTIHDVVNKQKKEKGKKTSPYNVKIAMDKINAKYEFIERTFNTESGIMVKTQKKNRKRRSRSSVKF